MERKLFDHGYEIHDGFVWRDSMAITYLDPATFKVHTATLVEDKNGVCTLYYGERKPMSGVDPASYREWEYNIAMDKNHVYRDSEIIEGADPKTFQRIGESDFYMDKKAYYEINSNSSTSYNRLCDRLKNETPRVDYSYLICSHGVWHAWRRVEDADSETFQGLSEHYGKDKNHVYAFEQKLDDEDPRVFKVLSETCAEGKEMIYFHEYIFTGIDKNTLEILDRNYIKDMHHVIYRGHFISNADPKTFRVMEESWYYSRDNKAVYYKGNKLANADPNTFEVIDPIFVKDSDNVFRNGEEIISAQPNSFHVVTYAYSYDDTHIFYDTMNIGVFDGKAESEDLYNSYLLTNKHVFYKGKILVNADPKSFRSIDEYMHYTRDNTYVWYDGVLLVGADPESFRKGLSYAFDKKYAWYGTKRFKPLSIENFTEIGYDWARDTTKFFYCGKKRLDVDLESFINLGNGWAQDKLGRLNNGKRVGYMPTLDELSKLSDEELKWDLIDYAYTYRKKHNLNDISEISCVPLLYLCTTNIFEGDWGNGGIEQCIYNGGVESLSIVEKAYAAFGMKEQADVVSQISTEYTREKNAFETRMNQKYDTRAYLSTNPEFSLKHFDRFYHFFEDEKTSAFQGKFLREYLKEIRDFLEG